MNQVQANKYSIAWFKLAECVARRERERALGVYRLLAHSFDSRALAFQLEGDIILAFNEPENAIAKYMQAAQMYDKEGALMQAIAVYDHIITLQASAELLLKIVESAVRMQNTKSIPVYIKRLCNYLIEKGDIGQLISLLQEVTIEFNLKAAFLIEAVEIVIEDKEIDRQIKLKLINETVEFLLHDDQVLKLLLMTLKKLDNDAYQYACICIEQ
jgi:hypothetical protein